jgi:hypothetical protein
MTGFSPSSATIARDVGRCSKVLDDTHAAGVPVKENWARETKKAPRDRCASSFSCSVTAPQRRRRRRRGKKDWRLVHFMAVMREFEIISHF